MDGLPGCSNGGQWAGKGGATAFVLFLVVRPQLEYWVPFWFMHFKRDMFR